MMNLGQPRIRIALLSATLLLVSLVIASNPARADTPQCAGPGIYLTYYTAASPPRGIAGRAGETCDYVCIAWGQTTPYVEEVDYSCY